MHHLDRSDPAIYQPAQDDATYCYTDSPAHPKGSLNRSLLSVKIPPNTIIGSIDGSLLLSANVCYGSLKYFKERARDHILYNYSYQYLSDENTLDCFYRITQQNINIYSYEWWKDHTKYNYVLIEFKDYLDATKDRYIILEQQKVIDGELIEQRIAIPYKTRFTKSYRDQVLRRTDKVYFKQGYFITLTTSLRNFHNIIEATESLKKQANVFFTALRRIKNKPRYLCITEFGKINYMVHLHILTDCYITEEEQAYLERVWLKQGVKTKFEPLRNVYASVYIKKYLNKGFLLNGDPKHDVIPALFWLTNKRAYSYSKGLIPPLSKRINKDPTIKKDKGNWCYIGMITAFQYKIDRYVKGDRVIYDIPDPPEPT